MDEAQGVLLLVPWAYGVVALPLVAAAVVHLWWLPKHGVSGWTGDPKARYYELVGYCRPGEGGPPAAQR